MVNQSTPNAQLGVRFSLPPQNVLYYFDMVILASIGIFFLLASPLLLEYFFGNFSWKNKVIYVFPWIIFLLVSILALYNEKVGIISANSRAEAFGYALIVIFSFSIFFLPMYYFSSFVLRTAYRTQSHILLILLLVFIAVAATFFSVKVV